MRAIEQMTQEERAVLIKKWGRNSNEARKLWDFLYALRISDPYLLLLVPVFKKNTDIECIAAIENGIADSSDDKQATKLLMLLISAAPQDRWWGRPRIEHVLMRIQDRLITTRERTEFFETHGMIVDVLLDTWERTLGGLFWDEEEEISKEVFRHLMNSMRIPRMKKRIEESIQKALHHNHRKMWNSSDEKFGRRNIQILADFLKIVQEAFVNANTSTPNYEPNNPFNNLVRIMSVNLLRHMRAQDLGELTLSRLGDMQRID